MLLLVLFSYYFLEYETQDQAQAAVANLNGYALDKSHKFKINYFGDFEKYRQFSAKAEIEEPAPYKDPGNLMWWLTINECYDQFVVLHGDIFTSVYLNTPNQPSLLETREVS